MITSVPIILHSGVLRIKHCFFDERGVILNIFDCWIGLFKTRDGIIDIEFGPWGVIASLLILLYPVIFIWEGDPKDD
jgi:hypothetical protein